MAFLPTLSPGELHNFYGVVTRSVGVRNHLQLLHWLQGEMQTYLPHSIMIAAWGDFHGNGDIQHDILSPLTDVRSQNANPKSLNPLLLDLFLLWSKSGCKPLALNLGERGFLLQDTGLKCALGDALQNMRSAMVHGINDERGHQDCLYVVFSENDCFEDIELSTMAVILPFIDTALRQIEQLPQQIPFKTQDKSTDTMGIKLSHTHDLTQRETEILNWVAMGKTNPEIGSILSISAFTVKNHMQRVFRKLDVINRAQAVNKVIAQRPHV
jgi:transcriptional regulator EpsA